MSEEKKAAGKEVWQFEEGEQPKLLSDGYVVETENFKRVGDWMQCTYGSGSTWFNARKILRFNTSSVRGDGIDIWYEGYDGVFLLKGTEEELLQVLA
jgi:hypothetical protein